MRSLSFQVALLALFIPTLTLSLTCEGFIERMTERSLNKDYSNLDQQEQAFKENTGIFKGATLTAKINACDELSNMKSFTAVSDIRYGSARRIQNGHTVCLPIECDNEDLVIDQALLTKLYKLKRWSLTADQKLRLYDPKKSMAPKTASYYLACFLFLSLIASVTVSTYFAYQSNKITKELPLKDAAAAKAKAKLCWIYESFDMKKNIVSLYQTAGDQKLNENLAIFGFLRVITSWWVIYYHSQYTLSLTSESFGKFWGDFSKSKFLNNLWNGGDLSVEYFFVMTGFLSAYTLIPKLAKSKFTFGCYLTIIKHRLLRIWPALILGLLFWWQIVPRMFSGPLWFHYEYKVSICDSLWWSKALLIENITNYYTYKEAGNYCMIITWYIPTEFQIYLVAVLAVALYTRYRRVGIAVIFALIFQSFFMGAANLINHRIVYPTLNDNGLWHYFRMTPFTRWYTLFIGVIWGIWYYEYTKLQKKNIFYVFEKKAIVSYLSIILGVALNIFVLNYPVAKEFSRTFRMVWFPLRVLLISISMTMIFMPLASNRQFYLKKFFNLRIFQVMGKYSYMTYLFADSLIYVFSLLDYETRPAFSGFGILFFSTKVFLVGQVIAIIAHLLIEKPILSLEGFLLRSKAAAEAQAPKRSPQPIQDDQEDLDKLIKNSSSSHMKVV